MIEFIHPKTGQIYQVTSKDLEQEVDWDTAARYAAEEGEGWRLPTVEEFELFYRVLYVRDLGNFKDGWNQWYWTSDELDLFPILGYEETDYSIYSFKIIDRFPCDRNETNFARFVRVL